MSSHRYLIQFSPKKTPHLFTDVLVIGAGIAGWHVWLQHTPRGKTVECGPGLEYMFDAFPLTKALPMIFKGSGDCGNIVWSFLGLSIPGWALVWFILLTLAGLSLLVQALRQRKHATA